MKRQSVLNNQKKVGLYSSELTAAAVKILNGQDTGNDPSYYEEPTENSDVIEGTPEQRVKSDPSEVSEIIGHWWEIFHALFN